MESPQTKYQVQIMMKNSPTRVPKAVQETLKGVVSRKMISKMKYETIQCPILQIERPFLECFACESFIRRFKGEVHCSGGKATIFK